PLLAAAIQAETGYQVLTFDITVVQRIPCVWALARNPTSDGRPALAWAAGSHPGPGQAIRNALAELAPARRQLSRRDADGRAPERARRMAADPQLVTTMEDHALLYADPEAASRLDFLRGGAPARRVAEVGGGDRGGFDSDDLRDNLLEAVA